MLHWSVILSTVLFPRRCNCHPTGSLGVECNAMNGQCECRQNVMSLLCDVCKVGYFNLQEKNPDGCQPCFCYGHGDACDDARGYRPLLITAARWVGLLCRGRDSLSEVVRGTHKTGNKIETILVIWFRFSIDESHSPCCSDNQGQHGRSSSLISSFHGWPIPTIHLYQ